MFYHVVRRPLHNSTDLNQPRRSSSKTNQSIKLMPRYHYSRVAPTTTNAPDSYFSRQNLLGNSARPIMTATASNNPTNNHNNLYTYGSFKSTFIPLTTNNNNRPFTSINNKRDSVQIPVIREDGTNVGETSIRTVPVTFINTTTSSTNPLSNTTTNNSKTQYTSFLRPTSKYSPNHLHKNGEEQLGSNLPTTLPRLSSAPRRLSLTIPVVTNVNLPTPRESVDDINGNHSSTSQSNRPIPLRFPPGVNPTPPLSMNNSRTSSAVLRPIVKSNLVNGNAQRQKLDINDSNTTVETFPSSSARRAELMAREAIQGVVRFQEQQGENSPLEHSNGLLSMRSPALSRRFIINLRNNQSVSLDSRLSSANNKSNKPPIASSSARTPLRHAVYSPLFSQEELLPYPSHPATEDSLSLNSTNYGQFKNEFRMEIPVTLINSNDDQENSMQRTEDKSDVLGDDQPLLKINERCLSTNTNSALKSILKRSSSRDTVSRKNVSFMNA